MTTHFYDPSKRLLTENEGDDNERQVVLETVHRKRGLIAALKRVFASLFVNGPTAKEGTSSRQDDRGKTLVQEGPLVPPTFNPKKKTLYKKLLKPTTRKRVRGNKKGRKHQQTSIALADVGRINRKAKAESEMPPSVDDKDVEGFLFGEQDALQFERRGYESVAGDLQSMAIASNRGLSMFETGKSPMSTGPLPFSTDDRSTEPSLPSTLGTLSTVAAVATDERTRSQKPLKKSSFAELNLSTQQVKAKTLAAEFSNAGGKSRFVHAPLLSSNTNAEELGLPRKGKAKHRKAVSENNEGFSSSRTSLNNKRSQSADMLPSRKTKMKEKSEQKRQLDVSEELADTSQGLFPNEPKGNQLHQPLFSSTNKKQHSVRTLSPQTALDILASPQYQMKTLGNRRKGKNKENLSHNRVLPSTTEADNVLLPSPTAAQRNFAPVENLREDDF